MTHCGPGSVEQWTSHLHVVHFLDRLIFSSARVISGDVIARVISGDRGTIVNALLCCWSDTDPDIDLSGGVGVLQVATLTVFFP